MQSGSGRSAVKRGDIVWVRFHFPLKWLPALVLSSDDIGIQVTFFQNDAVSPSPSPSPSRTFFVDSEVLPFEAAFPSLVSRYIGDAPLLHSALRFLGRRILSGMRCPCLTGRDQVQPKRAHEFDPAGVLRFVRNAAVSPWVEAPRFACAVRAVAQVHAFRSYCSVKHRKIYKQIKKEGDNVKLLPSSSLGQKMMHSVNQESVALEPNENCQIISRNAVKNIAIGGIQRLNSIVPVWEGNSAPLFKNKHLIISENFMLSPLYMVRESLHSARQSLLGFKNISDQGIVDIYFEEFSTTTRTHISVPSNLMIHLRNYIDKSKDNALELCWRLPDKETVIYLSRRKRKRLDESASCHGFPRISGVQENEFDAYISKQTRPRISDIKMLEPDGSIQKVDSKRSQSCASLFNLVHCFHSNEFEVDSSEAKVKCMLGSDSSVYQERLQTSCNGDTTPLKSKRSARYITKLTRPRISYVKKLEQEGSIQKHHQASTCETSVNFTDEVQKADLKRSQNCLVHRVHSDKCEVNASAAKVKGMLKSDSSVYQERLQISKTHVPFFSPTSVHMKFPKSFKLPSKEQLVKKFRVFGSVDSSRTRVFCYAGSAQVAFLQEADAVAALKYARKKALFGKANNVRFWLDPFEHKRRGFKSHVLPPTTKTGSPLKSCLKNSNSLSKENGKKHRRVRFTIET